MQSNIFMNCESPGCNSFRSGSIANTGSKMSYLVLCFLTFLAAFCLNMTYMTVFYHRGLTHQAVRISPWMRAFVIRSGNWITGLDPKTWCCMHRLHHLYADTAKDPHSPLTYGIVGVLTAQLHSYNRTMARLLNSDQHYLSLVRDLDFPVNWLNRKGLGLLPYFIHGAIAVAAGLFFHTWLLGLAYFAGIMSHPIQGWLVNAFGHKYGYRNFPTEDNSKNNTLVAWFVMGEGFQNNHHYDPMSPTFAVKWWELDLGFVLCKLAQILNMINIPPHTAKKFPL